MSGSEPGEGDRVEVTVGPVAHGGHCVARLDGRVIFVRHALPGERVLAEITEVHRAYLRADAVEVRQAAPQRVSPPCPYARPGQCGGCDLQHVAPAAQRDWKAAVVREQLLRLGGLDAQEVDRLGVRVEELPGGMLGWRTRMRYTVDAADRAGLRKHRSHEVVPIDRCRIAHPRIQELPLLAPQGRRWPAAEAVEVVASGGGDTVVHPVPAGSGGVPSDRSGPGARTGGSDSLPDLTDGPPSGPSGMAAAGTAGPPGLVREYAVGRRWRLPADAFWQVHPAAADTLATVVLELLRPRPGEVAWDLYGGAGLFAAALAGAVGPGGRVTLVESAPAAVGAARDNLADLAQVEVVAARVETALSRRRVAGPVDLVVLDPPRSGAGAPVVTALAASGARAVAYVACDPAAFARDVRTFGQAGWRLARLHAYDLFPMTQHVECVGLLVPVTGR